MFTKVTILLPLVLTDLFAAGVSGVFLAEEQNEHDQSSNSSSRQLPIKLVLMSGKVVGSIDLNEDLKTLGDLQRFLRDPVDISTSSTTTSSTTGSTSKKIGRRYRRYHLVPPREFLSAGADSVQLQPGNQYNVLVKSPMQPLSDMLDFRLGRASSPDYPKSGRVKELVEQVYWGLVV